MDERNFYEEAVSILSGSSILLPELRHLQALQAAMLEQQEIRLITIMNDLENLKRRVGDMP